LGIAVLVHHIDPVVAPNEIQHGGEGYALRRI
jgi:hypothetical protein